MTFDEWWDTRIDETSGPVNVHDAQAAWEAAKRDQWVLCDERMPEPYQTCIVGRTDVQWPITAFWTGQKWCRDVTKEEFYITHWMPLPDPPNQEAEHASQ